MKNWQGVADTALHEAVTVTENGCGRFVVISVDEYARLKRQDRRAIRVEDLTDEEAALIAAAEVPSEYGYLDALLDDDA